MNQTYHDYEIIIVDDCSADGTMEFLNQEYEDIIGKSIFYVRNETNLGAGTSRNKGIFYARGDYIAFQDSDTLWAAQHRQ